MPEKEKEEVQNELKPPPVHFRFHLHLIAVFIKLC